MSLLSIQNLSFSHHAGLPLFSGVSFEIHAGDRVGLAGPNGCGKTTLLRLVEGELDPASGSIVRRRGLRTVALSQLLPRASPQTLEVFVSEKQVTEEWELHRVLEGLGFSEDRYATPLSHLSSGERVRAGLARCLLAAADLLLLDEPTNHLDVALREWLEDYLVTLDAAIVVVSHDRDFLNGVTTRTLFLERGRLVDFTGNYDSALEQKAQAEGLQWQQYDAQQRRFAAAERAAQQRAQLSQKVAKAPPGIRLCRDFYGRKAAKVARTGRILRERQQMEAAVAKPWQEQPIPKLDFPNVPRSGDVVLRAENLAHGFDADPLFENLSFQVRRGERWAISGPNGSGKTTFLRCLAGILSPDSGGVLLGAQVKVGYYAQEAENLDPTATAIETCLSASASESFARTLLGCWKLPAAQVTRPLGTLSAGERSKVALTRLLLSEVNLLLLDEPTNHLEMEAIDALLELLRQFPGTLVFVSHDRRLTRELDAHTLDLQGRHSGHRPGAAIMVQLPSG